MCDECSPEAINMSTYDHSMFLMIFGIYNNTKIRKFDLSHNDLTDEEAVAIRDCFRNNCPLQTLILSQNRICSTGARKITELIQVNKVIERLNVSHNH